MTKSPMKILKILTASSMLTGMASLAFAGSAAAGELESLTKALSGGKAYVKMRYRYENVDQAGFAKKANASTLRTKLGYTTAKFHGLAAMVEFENSTNIFDDKYNSTINGRTNYPVVVDPDHTEVNQAYGIFTGIEDTTIIGGRQAVNLDNQRFIGTVGFRQNDQTYDAAAVVNTSLPDTTILYGYVWNVNRIFGDDHPFGDLGTKTHLVNINYSGLEHLTGLQDVKVVGYAYVIDLNDIAVSSLSSQTYGGRIVGKTNVSGGVSVHYAVEYARQSDNADNATNYSTRYLMGEGGVGYGGLVVKAGYESLGSDNGIASFQTPLATLHAFNGWADVFLSTPINGLDDLYVKGVYVLKAPENPLDGLKVMAIYHDFNAQVGNANYGREFDAIISKKITKTFSISFAYADYSADTYGGDVRKMWVTLEANF